MKSINKQPVLVSGASMAGLSAAFWLNKAGYKVTVIEMAKEPRIHGAAVDLRGETIKTVKRMGIFEQLRANRLNVEKMEFKNSDDVSEGVVILNNGNLESLQDDLEIERETFVYTMMNLLKDDIEFIFNDSISALKEAPHEIIVILKNGPQRSFQLVFGCDGMHSNVRRIWFGEEKNYTYFLGAYFSITVLNKLLIPENMMQMYNVPCKGVVLNAYRNKTDVIFSFLSDEEIDYDYRDESQQKKIIHDQFAGEGWRTEELLQEVFLCKNFYFDKFCQVKMPSWTKGRVALIGDAGYCASPAAGMGATLSVEGAAVVVAALQKHKGDFEKAFREYNETFLPFVKEVQDMAKNNIKENFIPKTEADIRRRNAMTEVF